MNIMVINREEVGVVPGEQAVGCSHQKFRKFIILYIYCMNIVARNRDKEVGVVPGGQGLECSHEKLNKFIILYVY